MKLIEKALLPSILAIAALATLGCDPPEPDALEHSIVEEDRNEMFTHYVIEDAEGARKTAIAFHLGRPSVTVIGDAGTETLHATLTDDGLALQQQDASTIESVTPDECDSQDLALAREVLAWQSDASAFRLDAAEGAAVLGCIARCYGHYPTNVDAANGCSTGCYNAAAYN